MKQFFTLARIAGACMAQALSGAFVMKRLIVVAMLAGMMISAAHGQTIAQQRAAVTQQQAAVALKSSQEYLRAAGWQFQAMTPDGSTWTHSNYVGTVTLAKDGWLVLANDQKVRPERVALYLKGLEEAAAVPSTPSVPVPAPAPRETTSYRPEPRYVPSYRPQMPPDEDGADCDMIAKLYADIATARDAGVPMSFVISKLEETRGRAEVRALFMKVVTDVYTAEFKAPPAVMAAAAKVMCENLRDNG